MGTVELTRPDREDFAAFIAVPLRSYGADATEQQIAHEQLANEIDRSWGVLDDGRWVAGAGAFSMGLTVPGGAELPVAGITMIGVAPTHRRRGILTAILRRLHQDALDRDEPIAMLTATESSIYRRFGYGGASDVAHLEIPASAVHFDPPVQDPGSFDLTFDPAELEDVHSRIRGTRAGWMHLTPGQWAQLHADVGPIHGGGGARRTVVHRDGAGRPDGYVTWRVDAPRPGNRLAEHTLWIEMLVSPDPEVEAALWAFVSQIDLVTTVVWPTAPVEPTIRWRLIEPRQLRTLAVADMVWARILDVPRVLSARTYEAAGTLTFEVIDRFQPDLGGRFMLRVDRPGAQGSCTRVDDRAGVELRLDAADLATIALGGVHPSILGAAGRLVAGPDVLATADRLFGVPTRPWWPVEF